MKNVAFVNGFMANTELILCGGKYKMLFIPNANPLYLGIDVSMRDGVSLAVSFV